MKETVTYRLGQNVKSQGRIIQGIGVNALGQTIALVEWRQRNFPGGERWYTIEKADDLITIPLDLQQTAMDIVEAEDAETKQ